MNEDEIFNKEAFLFKSAGELARQKARILCHPIILGEINIIVSHASVIS